MATCNSRIPNYFSETPGWRALAGGVLAMAAWSSVALAADPVPATPTTTTTGSGPVVIDARRSLPIFPANSWKDGFFVEHSPIGDFGLHIRGTGIYGRDPLGRDSADQLIQNRFTLHAAALVSIAGWVELGAAMPFVLYQDGGGLQLSKAAIGDLRLLGKINMHLPDAGPQVAFSLGLGFQTATSGSAFGAGNISGYPRIIIDMPKLLAKRLHIAGNIGAIIAGTTRPCTADELAIIERQNQQMMMMPMMGTTMPGTGMNMTTNNTPVCEQRVLGLGNHIMWGVGASGALSPDNGLYITTELIGSFSVGSELATNSPLFWTVGLRRAKANKTFFTAAYGYGLTDSSPGHTVLVALGLVWETEPPAKKKEPPTVKVDINVSGLGAGAAVSVGGKDGAKSALPGKGDKGEGGKGDKGEGGKGDKGEGGKGDKGEGGDKPPAPPKPPKMEPYKVSTEVDLPEGLVPDEAKKGDSKGKK